MMHTMVYQGLAHTCTCSPGARWSSTSPGLPRGSPGPGQTMLGEVVVEVEEVEKVVKVDLGVQVEVKEEVKVEVEVVTCRLDRLSIVDHGEGGGARRGVAHNHGQHLEHSSPVPSPSPPSPPPPSPPPPPPPPPPTVLFISAWL